MTGMYQILRIDDSIVRKMDLKEGVNTIGNNLNPPLEDELIIAEAVRIDLLPTGEMFITPYERISCYLKPHNDSRCKLLETNTTSSLNPGDTCCLFPLKIWFKILYSMDKAENQIRAKRELEEENVQTEPPDKKFCSENFNLSNQLQNGVSDNEDSSLLVRTCFTNDLEKSEKNEEFRPCVDNFYSINKEKKVNCLGELSKKSVSCFDFKNKKTDSSLLFESDPTEPMYERFNPEFQKYVCNENKDKSEENNLVNTISSASNPVVCNSPSLRKKKKKNRDRDSRTSVQQKQKKSPPEEPNLNASNFKPESRQNPQKKSDHRCCDNKHKKIKDWRDFSPVYRLDDDSKDFNSESSVTASDDCDESLFIEFGIDDEPDELGSSFYSIEDE